MPRSPRTLLEQKVDVNAAQGAGVTALHWAAHWNDIDLARLLIDAGAHVNAANDLGVTPLSNACLNGSAGMVELLLRATANPNAATATGETVLMTCARTGNVSAVEVLLASGAERARGRNRPGADGADVGSGGEPRRCHRGARVQRSGSAGADAVEGCSGGQPEQRGLQAPRVGERRLHGTCLCGPHRRTGRRAGLARPGPRT